VIDGVVDGVGDGSSFAISVPDVGETRGEEGCGPVA
jgi:hypothetical protein